jgi:hypothetical protein
MSEKFLAVKKAPGLSQKVCYPNNLERQDVNFALQIFNEKTIAAITNEDTKEFLTIINKWWRVVNVKHPDKGKHLRDIYADPIRSSNQINFQFLQAFVSWLQSWEDLMILDVPKRAHKLSAETHFALSFTTKNLKCPDSKFHFTATK